MEEREYSVFCKIFYLRYFVLLLQECPPYPKSDGEIESLHSHFSHDFMYRYDTLQLLISEQYRLLKITDAR